MIETETRSETVIDGYCILELMGHRRLAGYTTEVTISGAGFLRIETPHHGTQFYPPGSVYGITPTTKAVVDDWAKRTAPRPVQPYLLLDRSDVCDELDDEPGDFDDEGGIV